jgi:uncharacterized membrane protein YbhN (UPF0104 family)
MRESVNASMITFRDLLSPRKAFVQTAFWFVGIALLIWIIKRAIETGDWSKVAQAEPAAIVVLIGCTALSLILNGTTFWITIQPVRRVRWVDMQMVNLVGNLLNYAPVRLGAIARIMYHHRVDRLKLLEIGAWFAMIAYILALGIGSCLVATLIRDRFDWLWVLLVIGQMAAGAVAAQIVVSHRLIRQHGAGIDTLFQDARGMWGAVALRLADIGAYAGRMGAALYILDIHLPLSHVIVLAVVALAASLIPFGRMGFREFCVAIAGARLGALTTDQPIPWEQLALIESAGEAMVFLPAGLIGLYWYRRRWCEWAEQARNE